MNKKKNSPILFVLAIIAGLLFWGSLITLVLRHGSGAPTNTAQSMQDQQRIQALQQRNQELEQQAQKDAELQKYQAAMQYMNEHKAVTCNGMVMGDMVNTTCN